MDGNARFRATFDRAFLAKLSKGQEPFVAILACSDSRVVPEKIFNLNIGDAFVVRVVGNSVADPGALGSLEYAFEHLHVTAIMVMGHTGCGAVQAVIAPDGREPEGLRLILRDIGRARYTLPTNQQSNVDTMVESNVRLQLKSIEESRVLGRAVAEGKLRLYGSVYELPTGNVRFV